MKLSRVLTTIFLMLSGYGTAENTASFRISYETHCIGTITDTEEYHALDNIDSGCHKTIIRMHDYPYGKEYIMRWSRPLFKKKKDVKRFLTLMQLNNNAEKLEERIPLFVMSSRGFLPGEKIKFSLVTPDRYVSSESMEFYPHPLVVNDDSSRVKLSAELQSIDPTVYVIHLENFNRNERLKYIASSGSGKIVQDIVFLKEIAIIYMPKIENQQGGTAVITVQRENGINMSLPLVWGTEFIPYLKGEKKVIDTNFTSLRSHVY